MSETETRTHREHDPVTDAVAGRVGTRLLDFEIKEVLGMGGIGAVYRAKAAGVSVAIKILHAHHAGKSNLVARYFDTAKAANHLGHPNIAKVIDRGVTPDGAPFLVLEHLDGETLRDCLRRVHHLPLFEAFNIAKQVARGLGAAHALGIRHGDLKPANIFLCKRVGRRRIVRRSKETGMRFAVVPEKSFDLVRLLDFGAEGFLAFDANAPAAADTKFGLPHTLSPEQIQGRTADGRSDIYALGAVLYEMITGTPVFEGDSAAKILQGHLSGTVMPPSLRLPGVGIDPRIDGLILKCLKRNPLMRFARTDEVCELLDACVTDSAFLRDAHRLPGIKFSGIDLSQASEDSRHASPSVAERPVAPVELVLVAAPVAVAKPATVAAPVAVIRPVTVHATASTKAAVPPHAPPPVPAAEARTRIETTRGVPEAASLIVAQGERSRSSTPTQTTSPTTVVRPVETTPIIELSGDALVPDRSSRARSIFVGITLVLGAVAIVVYGLRRGPSPEQTSQVQPPAPVAVVAHVPAAKPVPVVAPAPTETPPVTAESDPAATPAAQPVAAAPTAAEPVAAAPVIAVPAAPAAVAPTVDEPAPAPAADKEPSVEEIADDKSAPTKPRAVRRISRRTAANAGTIATKGTSASTDEHGKTSAPVTPPNAADLIRDSQLAWLAGQMKSSMQKAHEALRAHPTSAQTEQAYQLIGICSCALGMAEDAKSAMSFLDNIKRETVRAACAKKGLTIP